MSDMYLFVLTIILLLLIVGIVGVRYVEMRDLVKAIGKQTDALSLYVCEQRDTHSHTQHGLDRIEASCQRIERNIERLLRQETE